MNQNAKRCLNLLPVILLLVGCGGKRGPKNSDQSFTPGSDETGDQTLSFELSEREGQVLEENAAHHIDGTIHEFHSTKSSVAFADVGSECYFTVVSDPTDTNSNAAASFFISHASSALGVSIQSLNASEAAYDANAKRIYFGCPDAFKAAGLAAPEQEIGLSGYYIKSAGNSAFAEANSEYGYNLAVLHLLETLVGYDCLRYQTYVYAKAEKGGTLPFYNFDVVEIPDFEYRIAPGWADAGLIYAEGLTRAPMPNIETAEYSGFHNTYKMMGKYRSSHPEWFDDAGAADPSTGATVYQMCYTAHGNEDSLELEEQTVADTIINMMVQYPSVHGITFTQMDTQRYCDCETCHASFEKYGTTSAVQIKFLNAVSDLVQAYIKDETRDNVNVIPTDFSYIIYMFAYHDTMIAPATYDEASGQWKPIDDSVIMNPGTGVIIAPSYALYTHSFYEDQNTSTRSQILGWSACAQALYAYTYSINFRGYTYPYNCFAAMVDNARFWKENKANVLFYSSDYTCPILPGFMELRKYLDSKLGINVNIDPTYYTKKWFYYAYRDAWKTMYRLYQYERAYCQSIESIYTGTINDYDIFNNADAWPTGLMLKWWSLTDQAMDEIAPLKAKDADKYNSAHEAVLLESITPRYALLSLHPDYFGGDQLLSLRKQFRADIEELGITYVREHDGGVDTLWASWGV